VGLHRQDVDEPDPNAKPEESRHGSEKIDDGRALFRRGRDWEDGDAGSGRQEEGDDFQRDGHRRLRQCEKEIRRHLDGQHGHGLMMSEGDYDPATKTFTYASEYEAIPG